MTQANEGAAAAAPESAERLLVPCDKHALAIGQLAIIHSQRYPEHEDTGWLVAGEITASITGMRGPCGGESSRLCTWTERS